MMRKMMSVSALISGMLAAPMFAGAKPAAGEIDSNVVAEMRAHLTAMQEGLPTDAERMQALHQQMIEKARAEVGRVLGLSLARGVGNAEMVFVADDEPAAPGALQQREGTLTLLPSGAVMVQQTEKAAFLGIATSEVPGVLRDQLKLPRGMGLVVEFVTKDSPAAEAGVKAHDVLEKLDDQLLVNGPQFAVLVRAKKVGESAALTVIRGGERHVVRVKLGEKEMPVLEDGGAMRQPFNWQGSMAFQPPQGQQGFMAVPIDGGPGWERGVRKTVVTGPGGKVTRTLIDGANELTLTTDGNGKSELVVKDKENKEQYRGSYTTDDEKAKVPAAYAAEAKDLASSSASVNMEGLAGKQGNTLHAEVIKLSRADSDQQITLTFDQSGKSAVVKDVKTGKVVYEGPANTEDDFKAMPTGVAEKVKGMEAKIQGK